MVKKSRFLFVLAVFGLLLACNNPLIQPTATEIETTREPTIHPTTTLTPATDPYSGWQTYRNEGCGFELRYPPDGELVTGEGDLVRINLPFAPDTNLHEKYLEITCFTRTEICSNPLSEGIDLGFLDTETREINGITYTIQSSAEGAVGNIYNWTAYSTTRNDLCISLAFILRATNPMNYSTPPPEYDEAAESAIFEEIVTTLEWVVE